MNQLQLLQQGALHLQAGRTAEAERLFREILQGDPANGHANGMMGVLRLQQDRAADALPFFTAALARQPDPGTLINYGLALDRVGRQAEAVDAFDRASLGDYEALALKLARDPVLLGQYRRRLVENRDRCALFDTDRYRRGIEAAFEHMWEIAQRGGAPESFAVADLPGHS